MIDISRIVEAGSNVLLTSCKVNIYLQIKRVYIAEYSIMGCSCHTFLLILG